MSRGRRALTVAYASRLPLRSILIGAILTSPPTKDSTVRWQARWIGIPCTVIFLVMGMLLNSGVFYGMSVFCVIAFFLTKNKGV